MEKMDNSEQSFSKPSDVNFKFAFNDCNFSDRLLRIEIVCVRDSEADGCCNAAADWARQCKRRRHNSNKLKVLDIPVCPEKQTINLDQPDVEERETCENQDEEVVIIDGESPRGDEAAHTQDSNLDMDCSTVVRVKTLHISSPILAAKSPFFYKLFSNGMRESDQRHVTLRIDASEEDSLMEVLQFMYSNTLSVSSAPELLDVLMAADKFEVASCMRYCSHLLRNMPMTPGSALLYLDLPTSVLMAEAVQQLTDAAKQFLAAHYKDINKCHEEVIALPLVGIEAILSSDDLQVGSEDVVYDFVLKWARVHYPNLEERREIMGSRLVHLIRFPHMTCRKLKKVLVCSDFEQGVSSKLVLEALFFKGETPHRQRALATQESAIMNRRFVERTYKFRPVKIVEFQLPRPQCVVYLDLKREEVANLYPSRRVYSQAFQLGGQGFFLSAHCNAEHQSLSKCFGLFLGMQEKGTSASFSVDYEFASRTMHNEEFISKYKGNYKFTRGKAVGYRNLFSMPWEDFLSDESIYFINSILHLRAVLTIKH